VGICKWLKNFKFMVEALADMIKKRKIYIYCVGKPFDKDEKILFDSLGIKDYMLQYRASDNELKYLYVNALGFIFPSFYEGFGIPILEAFHSGCPTLLSESSCFPEVAKDGAIYFDPCDKSSILDSVESLLDGKYDLKNLTDIAKKIALEYTWEKSAKETFEFYKKIAER